MRFSRDVGFPESLKKSQLVQMGHKFIHLHIYSIRILKSILNLISSINPFYIGIFKIILNLTSTINLYFKNVFYLNAILFTHENEYLYLVYNMG